jgi:putative ABC transport system permease protein
MNLLIGALTIGLILSFLGLGVYVAFRIFAFADMTADGAITLGAAVTAILLTHGVHPVLATAAGTAAGVVAGTVTGILHTRFKINGLLCGILVMTALYSVNLHVMGRSNVPLLSVTTLSTLADRVAMRLTGGEAEVQVLGWPVMVRDLAMLGLVVLIVLVVGAALHGFFRTRLGTAMRATGDNPQMIRAMGVHTGNMIVMGLALSNGLVAFSGALLAQYQGFADVQMGIGMLVWGLASVIIGEALVNSRNLALAIAGAVMGSILFRLLVALALRWGLNPNDLKLITAVFVLVALVLPGWLARIRGRRVEAPC